MSSISLSSGAKLLTWYSETPPNLAESVYAWYARFNWQFNRSCAAAFVIEQGDFRIWIGGSWPAANQAALLEQLPDVDVCVWTSEFRPVDLNLVSTLSPEIIIIQGQPEELQSTYSTELALLLVPHADHTHLSQQIYVHRTAWPEDTPLVHPYGLVDDSQSAVALVIEAFSGGAYHVSASSIPDISVVQPPLPLHRVRVFLQSVEETKPGCVGARYHYVSVEGTPWDGVIPATPSVRQSVRPIYETLISEPTTLYLAAKAVEYDKVYDDVGTGSLLTRVNASPGSYEVHIDVSVSEGYGPGAGCKETWRFTFQIDVDAMDSSD
jgi:hypothetical protein